MVSQQVENDVRPQVFFTNFPNWVLYTRDIPQAGGGWKDVLVADTAQADDTTVIYMASRGRLVLDREKQTVDLVLEDGTRYSSRGDRRQGGRDLPVPERADRHSWIRRAVFPRLQADARHSTR